MTDGFIQSDLVNSVTVGNVKVLQVLDLKSFSLFKGSSQDYVKRHSGSELEQLERGNMLWTGPGESYITAD